MRIVIDLQGAQTESRFRGIGRYSLSLAQAIAKNRGEHEILIALNALFLETIQPIRSTFNGLLPSENIRVWHALGPVRECQTGNLWRRSAAEKIREAFLASLQPDLVFVSSIFEGYVDDAVTSLGLFPSVFPTVITLYDLIPLLNPEKYFASNPSYEEYYRRKLEYFQRASGCVAISESSAREGVKALNIPEDMICNISSACDNRFRKSEKCAKSKHIKSKHIKSLLSKFGISKPFILNTGGADERKNLPRLIHAFSLLPAEIKERYQLVLAGKIPEGVSRGLADHAKTTGLRPGDCIFTGYIPDDDLVELYNRCSLFVFPSWHEGFGLPPLEAMNCGAPVIGSETSSLPEVIGWKEAIFDPSDTKAITRKIERALTDEQFRRKLIENGETQSKRFSWDDSARKAITFFQTCLDCFRKQKTCSNLAGEKPKLAYISPLPPERTGIADYSAELLRALAKHYEITAIVEQDEVSDFWIQLYCEIRTPRWLRENREMFDRVIYHFGNSPFHSHMFSLLEDIPGVVVLHDFFLSAVYAFCELNGIFPHFWTKELYHSHGYLAVKERFYTPLLQDVIYKYPVNLNVIQHSLAVLTHSLYSKQLATQWYEESPGLAFHEIPFPKTLPPKKDKVFSRKKLNIPQDAFLVCAFGMLDSTKRNHSLLNAWKQSVLKDDPRCFLVFVGENHGGDYGKQLLDSISTKTSDSNVRISGWVSMEDYQHFLASADLAVQLRTLSRGETSAAVHDCLAYGIPTIVNANGSFQFLDKQSVYMVSDDFSEFELVEALEGLRKNEQKRCNLSYHASKMIQDKHLPSISAEKYVEEIENTLQTLHFSHELRRSLGNEFSMIGEEECRALMRAISMNHPQPGRPGQLLIDISATCRNDLKTGIERVARSLVLALLNSPPQGYRVEPVYLSDEGGRWHYRYARGYTMRLLECPPDILTNDAAEYHNGDILLCADLSGSLLVNAYREGLFLEMKTQGVRLFSMIFDILPLTMPHCFPEGADRMHLEWLNVVLEMHGCICISKAVADELGLWIAQRAPSKLTSFQIEWSHLGADVDTSAPSTGLLRDTEDVLSRITQALSFLMVGTIEPRKGYLQAIQAFNELWEAGESFNLVIVGKEGWKDLPQEMRRTIPEIIQRLENHPQRGKRLFWLEGISDEYLEKVYEASTCLIFASEGEGFGLPLIEAAKHGLPIIAP